MAPARVFHIPPPLQPDLAVTADRCPDVKLNVSIRAAALTRLEDCRNRKTETTSRDTKQRTKSRKHVCSGEHRSPPRPRISPKLSCLALSVQFIFLYIILSQLLLHIPNTIHTIALTHLVSIVQRVYSSARRRHQYPDLARIPQTKCLANSVAWILSGFCPKDDQSLDCAFNLIILDAIERITVAFAERPVKMSKSKLT